MVLFGKKKPDEPVVARYAPSAAGAANAPSVAAAAVTTTAAAGGAVTGALKDAALKEEGSRLTVGPNIRLTGSEISDCDTVIIEGRVEATVDGRVMQIAETGTFSGTVAIDMAEIRGQFHGELTVRKRLTVCGTGKVQGKIRYGALVVEEGGELSGDIDSLGTVAASPAGTAPAREIKVGPAPVARPEVTRLPG